MTAIGFIVHVYLLVAFMAMGSWGLYIALIALQPFTGREYVELRIVITFFGLISYGILALMSFNVTVPDGSGGFLVGSYQSMTAISLIAALIMGLFLIDSIMRAMGREAPTGTADRDLEI